MIIKPPKIIAIKAEINCPNILAQGFNFLKSSTRPIKKRIKRAVTRPAISCCGALFKIMPSDRHEIIPSKIPRPPRSGMGVWCIFSGSPEGWSSKFVLRAILMTIGVLSTVIKNEITNNKIELIIFQFILPALMSSLSQIMHSKPQIHPVRYLLYSN